MLLLEDVQPHIEVPFTSGRITASCCWLFYVNSSRTSVSFLTQELNLTAVDVWPGPGLHWWDILSYLDTGFVIRAVQESHLEGHSLQALGRLLRWFGALAWRRSFGFVIWIFVIIQAFAILVLKNQVVILYVSNKKQTWWLWIMSGLEQKGQKVLSWIPVWSSICSLNRKVEH